MEVALTASEGRLFQLFTTRLLKKCWRIVALKCDFFNLKLYPLVIELLSTANKCSNNGSYPFSTLKTMIMSPCIRRYFMLGISIFASLSSKVKFDNRGNILEARRWTLSIKSSSFFRSGYQVVTQYSRWGQTREINTWMRSCLENCMIFK